MTLLVQYTLLFSAVLLLVALGGCFSEHSGVINLGLEGIMIMGALGGALTMNFLPSKEVLKDGQLVQVPALPYFAVILLVVCASALLGMLYAVFLAVAAVNFKADQTLVGIAMNMLALAGSTVIVKAINMSAGTSNVSSVVKYMVNKTALIGTIGGFQYNWFMLVALLALIGGHVVLYKTRFGLRLMACGEHPQAVDSVGVSVYKMRWAGVLISGALGGLGGIAYITAGSSEWKFEEGVAGLGFLSLAVMIFGQWKPVRIALAALLFGFFRALGSVYSGIGFLAAMKIPSTVYNMMPYIISLVVLAFTSAKSRAPKAEGIPYDKGSR